MGRVELLIEVSKTENGKFYIVVFQRYLKPKKTAANAITVGGGATEMEKQPIQTTTASHFDDIQVKEMWQLEAIQLLKRFNNDL